MTTYLITNLIDFSFEQKQQSQENSYLSYQTRSCKKCLLSHLSSYRLSDILIILAKLIHNMAVIYSSTSF